MVAEQKYRSDLYYRINGFPIQISRLRERKEDISELTQGCENSASPVN
jgi:transcriptional regulator with GAF, ATPase, and Fis domain